jgi:c(7)-type cytochrome triheme protein
MSWRALGEVTCAALIGLVLGAITPACAPDRRHSFLSTVFDGVPPPGEDKPSRHHRRAEQSSPEVARSAGEAQPAEPLPPPPTWATYAELEAALPLDSVGNIDWVAAIQAGAVKPRAGIGPDARDMPVFSLDIHRDPGIPGLEVVFPHGAHTQWLSCENCHPAIFEMRANANPINMTKIFAGEYCGRCHGKVAFNPVTGCPRCHVKFGAPGS